MTSSEGDTVPSNRDGIVGGGGAWTQYLPEAFGIRQSIQKSPFRWCVKESFMWGIATGTGMGIHRLRMGSHPFLALNVAFGTSLLVCMPSYYFCFRTRENKEKVIEMMMAANDFRHGDEMPEPVAMEEHPFLEPKEQETLDKEFRAQLKERKDWQKPPSASERDPFQVFEEVPKGGQ